LVIFTDIYTNNHINGELSTRTFIDIVVDRLRVKAKIRVSGLNPGHFVKIDKIFEIAQFYP